MATRSGRRYPVTADHDLSVVFGAGPLALAVMRALRADGTTVRVVSRSGRAEVPPEVQVVAADATDHAAVRGAFTGARVVFHCAAAAYAEWPTKLPPIMDGAIEGAASAGATLVYGDNLYAYGPVERPLTEDLPYRATGPNGMTRARLAESLMAAHAHGRVRAVIGRASDFFGPHVMRSTVGERVFGRVLRGQAAQWVGDPDVPHTFTFIDDFARGLVTLSERPEAIGEVWHVPSAATVTARRFVEMVFAEAGRGSSRLQVPPPAVLAVLALFDPTLRALREQRYQTERPFVVDHGKFERAFGARPTPHLDAIRRTLEWYTTRMHERQERAKPAV